MATANVPTESGVWEGDENAMRQREALSRCFSGIRKRLDERERQLSLQLEQRLRENQIHKNKLATDRLQLESASEHIKSCLSSNSLKGTGNEAVKVFEQQLQKLNKDMKRVQFDSNPQLLYDEINKIGEISLLPLFPQDCSESRNCKRIPPESVTTASFGVQKREIHSLLSRVFVNGEAWYLIHIRWFKQWKSYVGYDDWNKSQAGNEANKPGPIDNTSLLDCNGNLEKKQVYEIDYKLVPALAWNKFLSWYGAIGESVEIKRLVVKYGEVVKQYKVEVYPLELKACCYPKENEFKIVVLSRCDTMRTLERKMRELYSIAPNKQTRVYYRSLTYPYKLMQNMYRGDQEVGLIDGQTVLLEVQNINGTWPRKEKRNLCYE